MSKPACVIEEWKPIDSPNRTVYIVCPTKEWDENDQRWSGDIDDPYAEFNTLEDAEMFSKVLLPPVIAEMGENWRMSLKEYDALKDGVADYEPT